MTEIIGDSNEFLDRVHFEIPEKKPILKIDRGDALSFLLQREMRLLAELQETREMLAKLQGFTPKITGGVEGAGNGRAGE